LPAIRLLAVAERLEEPHQQLESPAAAVMRQQLGLAVAEAQRLVSGAAYQPSAGSAPNACANALRRGAAPVASRADDSPHALARPPLRVHLRADTVKA
jgi:hypothetical protein